jgi:hypothetical protein
MAEFSLEKIIKDGVEQALKEPIADGKSVTEWAAIGMTAPRWISVKDRLPEEGVCLGCHGSSVGIYGYLFGEWFDEDDCICEEGYVTHWMPLPAPPKE